MICAGCGCKMSRNFLEPLMGETLIAVCQLCCATVGDAHDVDRSGVGYRLVLDHENPREGGDGGRRRLLEC